MSAFLCPLPQPVIGLHPDPATRNSLLDLTLLPRGDYQVSVLDATRHVLLATRLPAGARHWLPLAASGSHPYALLLRGTATDGTRIHIAQRFN